METLQRMCDFAFTTNNHWACSDRLVSNRCMATHLDFTASLNTHSVALHLIPSFCLPQRIHCIPLMFYFFVFPNEEQQIARSWKKLWKKIILEFLAHTGTKDLHGFFVNLELNPRLSVHNESCLPGWMNKWRNRNPVTQPTVWMLGVILILKDWDRVERGCALVRMVGGIRCCTTAVAHFIMTIFMVV